MTDAKAGSGRNTLLLIALVFFGPLLVAAWLYFGGEGLQPAGRTNHGVLLEPVVNLGESLPNSALDTLQEDKWLLLLNEPGTCATECRQGLYAMRQMRLMLGKEMDRLARLLLHGETAPDTVFLADEHQGLMTLRDKALGDYLAIKKPAAAKTGGYYLIDPHGNLVMYFPPDLAPGDIVSDQKRLLKLSRIG
jgi:hypothetical protein